MKIARTHSVSEGCNGYLYIIHSDKKKKYWKQTLVSASSLKRVTPDAKIALLTDRPVSENPLFDKVIVKEDLVPEELWRKTGHPYGRVDGFMEGKMRLDLTPFWGTLYVDCDTYFYEDVSGLFRLLEWFDMAMVPVAGDSNIRDPNTHEEVEGFTPYNHGVMLYRKNQETLELFKRWNEIYRSEQRSVQKRKNDQPYLLLALAESDRVKVHSLPRIYNARVNRPISLFGPVKIAHGKYGVDFEAIRVEINRRTDVRCWNPKEMKLYE